VKALGLEPRTYGLKDSSGIVTTPIAIADCVESESRFAENLPEAVLRSPILPQVVDAMLAMLSPENKERLSILLRSQNEEET
jgi:hypothetical protein